MRSRHRSHTTMLAGWLFADLMLVLLVTGLATLPAKTPAAGEPGPPPPPAPTRQQGLDPHHLDFNVEVTPDAFRNGAVDELVRQTDLSLSQLDPAHRMVGFVLVFASDDQGHITRAQDTATSAVDALRERSPVFAQSTGLGYWNGNRSNHFEFKVFLLN